MKNDLFDVKIQHMRTRRCMWACTFFLSAVYLNYHHEYVWGILCGLAMVFNIVLSESFDNENEKKKEKENDRH